MERFACAAAVRDRRERSDGIVTARRMRADGQIARHGTSLFCAPGELAKFRHLL